MEKIGMVDEAFLLARMAKGKSTPGGDGPSREEFNELVERVDIVETVAESKQDALESGVNIKTLNGDSLMGSGNAVTGFIAIYGETSAADIIEYMESVPNNSAPIIVKRGNDYYTSILSIKQADNKVLVRCVGSSSGSYYIFNYTVTNGSWASSGAGLQNILISGENIKTINGISVLGAGDIITEGSDNVFLAEYDVTEYSDIEEAIAANKIIILHDPETVPNGGNGYFLVTNPEALEGTAVLNVYGAKTFGRYQIGMGRWVKFWEPLDSGGESSGVFKAIWGQTTAQELLEAIDNKDILAVYNPSQNTLQPATFIDVKTSSGNVADIVLTGPGPFGEPNDISQSHVRITDGMWELVDSVRVFPNTLKVNEAVRIGRYNDGSSVYPLYRKTVDIGNLPDTASKTIAHTLPSGFRVLSITGVAYNQNFTNTLPIPNAAINPEYSIYTAVGSSNITITTGNDRSSYTGIVTIEYYIKN